MGIVRGDAFEAIKMSGMMAGIIVGDEMTVGLLGSRRMEGLAEEDALLAFESKRWR
jgi:hypothetical protein